MARYMFDWGEPTEFEAKNPDEVVSCLKQIFRQENDSDKTFRNYMRSNDVVRNGFGLNTQCNRSFVHSLNDAKLLVNLSEHSEKQQSHFLFKWSEHGFSKMELGLLTTRQLEANTSFALKLRKIAKSLDDAKFAEILHCELDGADYKKRYRLITDEKQKMPLAVLNFIMTMAKDEEVLNPAASHLFPIIYTRFPGNLFDFALLWQFILRQPMGLEFVRSGLSYLSDLLDHHPNHKHELISDYVPSPNVPVHANLYFAYGSNMDHVQMRSRCPSAEFIGLASLKNFTYYINNNGVASIKPKYGATVWGVIWDIQDSCDWDALDRYEGVSSNSYQRHTIETIFGDELVSCQGYVSTTPSQGVPRLGYQEKITQAVLFHKKLYERKSPIMDGEAAIWYLDDTPFKFWHNEMTCWLGAENG